MLFALIPYDLAVFVNLIEKPGRPPETPERQPRSKQKLNYNNFNIEVLTDKLIALILQAWKSKFFFNQFLFVDRKKEKELLIEILIKYEKQ